MSNAIFRDFIPAEEDPGAIGSGYNDFVPERKPEYKPEEKVEEPKVKPLKPTK